MTICFTDRWLELPGRLVAEPGTLRLREPMTADIPDIVRRLRANEYTKPFVVDDGRSRRLHFSLDYVQSEMSLRDPDALNFAYTREMMAFLLFVPRPRHVVLVGLGGGSLTKFCYRQLPAARITTIEIDADVLGFATQFEVPEPDARLRLIHADAVDHFATTEEDMDVVLIDGCDRSGICAGFRDAQFYRNIHARLRPHGVLVMNLIGPGREIDAHLNLLAEVFAGPVLVRRMNHGGNRIAFAFRDATFRPDWIAIQRVARRLEALYGLDFAACAARLRNCRRVAADAGDD
ncbi:spermidine synthase [Fontimonas sp. SYSU GA230001]|uniref:spermine/spermidine synthase domain-containing protein n=1 Tax=Fontimonas sp. SYSU GA230001 TaxID=3142450 RepID=UPI0032B457EB